ncbi:hypothetical protein ATANTOWER_026236 [Ataeniobius toweri]|uniref:Uncharacterized protein n=1 Tax=Ataeniobius toweri TaxID=208326 RepID=A0ABU7AHK7_9TELE|nr:hypothetical protein [Ataeniobius toweri]
MHGHVILHAYMEVVKKQRLKSVGFFKTRSITSLKVSSLQTVEIFSGRFILFLQNCQSINSGSGFIFVNIVLLSKSLAKSWITVTNFWRKSFYEHMNTLGCCFPNKSQLFTRRRKTQVKKTMFNLKQVSINI